MKKEQNYYYDAMDCLCAGNTTNAGSSPRDIDAMFDEGNESQNWDKLAMLLDAQNEKHKFWDEPSEY
ncbi:MAG: hypothetical protein U9R38_05485 [Candidatus Margulisiibacteriota bacterium]|nr:hypothetical protein [Candidatus Margulisiibacteriota bacterium]